MTVETETASVVYTGSGSTGPFTVPFYFINDEDLTVIRTTIADGTEATFVLSTDYTVSGAGDEAGGSITLTATLSSAYKLTIIRDPQILQETDYPPNDEFPAESHERALDLLTMIAQRHDGQIEKAVKFSDGYLGAADPTLPPPGAGKGFRWNVGGTALETVTLDDLGDTFLQSGTGAVARSWSSKVGEAVSVKDFDAIGDGVTNDWEDCQKACDHIQSLGGGVVWFPPGTYRIAGNTIILWGDNVLLMGYGATLYKDNAGGSAGTYGDALTVFGKLNGNLYWSPQVAGGDYTTPALYSGATTPSKNITIEGFKVTFGTHSSDTINGISGMNYEHLTVRNCETVDAPQTGFAWIATDNAHAKHLTLDNCFSNGAGMQGFRFNSYTPNAGELTAKVINCRTEGTVLTVATPWPEQYDLPSSAFVRASGGDLQFQVSFDTCQFDETVHLLDGYRTTSFRNCRLAHVFALNASAHCALEFDNCRFREFDAATGFGGIDAQLFARNTYNGQAKISLKNCTFETPATGDYTIYNRGFDIDIADCIGQVAVYSIDWSTYLPTLRIRGAHLKDPGSSPLTFAGDLVEVDQCRIYTPIDIIQAHRKAVVVRGSRFIVDASFSTYCITVTHGNVVAEGNIIEYTNNAYATILVAPIANTLLKNNQYLYDGDTTFSKDEIYGTGAPANGYWQVSSRVINSAPTAGQPKAWVCTVAGAPGTWVSEGNL